MIYERIVTAMYPMNYNSVMPSRVAEVNGINGANAYQLAPNSSVLLLDSQKPIVYLKQTDGAGYGTVNAFDLVEHKDERTKNFENIDERLKRLEQMIYEQASTEQPKSGQQPNEQPTNATGSAAVPDARNDSSAIGHANSSTARY